MTVSNLCSSFVQLQLVGKLQLIAGVIADSHCRICAAAVTLTASTRSLYRSSALDTWQCLMTYKQTEPCVYLQASTHMQQTYWHAMPTVKLVVQPLTVMSLDLMIRFWCTTSVKCTAHSNMLIQAKSTLILVHQPVRSGEKVDSVRCLHVKVQRGT